jgi:protein-disulfide isomerase
MMRLRLFLMSLALTAALSGTVTTGAHAAESFSDAQKSELGQIIRDYLIKNPEVLQEAFIELDRKQKSAEADAQKKTLAAVGAKLNSAEEGIVVGNPKGDVTIVEFFDYNCGYCKKAMADIMEMMKADPKLRVILRDFPVLGPDSLDASLVALAARNQFSGDKYMEYHTALLTSKGRIGKDRALDVAKELGADMDKLKKDLESGEPRKLVDSTIRIADALKIGGTPTFVVGDSVIVGAVGKEPLSEAVSNIRTCGKAVC